MTTPPALPKPAPSRWLPLLLAVAIFMQMLDTTILNTALPKMALDLNESPLNMQSAVIAYALTLALLIPLSGYLADRFGTRSVFIASMGIFVLGSILCAAAPNLSMLLVARVIQGIGGSMLVPVPRLTLLRVYDKSQLLNAINYAVMPALIGPVLGPLVGGYLVDYASWHWIFLINVPIGIAGMVFAFKVMPDLKGEGKEHFDVVGFLLFAAAACSLSLSVEIVTHPGTRFFAMLMALSGAAALWLYWQHAKRDDAPLYARNLFQVRTFRLGLAGNLFSRLGISSVPFLLPLLFQLAFGFSASLSGWLLAPIAIASILVKPLIKPLMGYFGYRRVLVANTRLLGCLMMCLAIPSAHTPLWLWAALLFVVGMGNSLQFSAMNTLTVADLRSFQTGSGNSLMAVNQQLAMSFGIALGALILQFLSQSSIATDNLHTAFRYTFIYLGAITFISSWIFVGLDNRDGRNLTQKAPKS